MTLSNMLDGLQRAPWLAAARHILGRARYDTARGYKRTVQALLAQRKDPAKIAVLEAGLREHLVAGEKYIQFIKLTALKSLWPDGKQP